MVDDTAFTQSAEAAGGDGFDVIVDPANANNWVGEYTDGTLYSTTDGGHSFSDFVELLLRGPGDGPPGAERELRPERAVRHAAGPGPAVPGTWVGGGEDVWVSTSGWNTSCATEATCDWTPVVRHRRRATRSPRCRRPATARSSTPRGSRRRQPRAGVRLGHRHELRRHLAPGGRAGPAEPVHRRRHRRPGPPGARVRDLQRVLPAVRPRRRHRPRLRDAERRPDWTDISGNLPDVASDALVLAHGHAGPGHRRRGLHRRASSGPPAPRGATSAPACRTSRSMT